MLAWALLRVAMRDGDGKVLQLSSELCQMRRAQIAAAAERRCRGQAARGGGAGDGDGASSSGGGCDCGECDGASEAEAQLLTSAEAPCACFECCRAAGEGGRPSAAEPAGTAAAAEAAMTAFDCGDAGDYVIAEEMDETTAAALWIAANARLPPPLDGGASDSRVLVQAEPPRRGEVGPRIRRIVCLPCGGGSSCGGGGGGGEGKGKKVASLRSQFEAVWATAARSASRGEYSSQELDWPDTPSGSDAGPATPLSFEPADPGTPCSSVAVEEARAVCAGKVSCLKPVVEGLAAEAARIRTSAEFHLGQPEDGIVCLEAARARSSCDGSAAPRRRGGGEAWSPAAGAAAAPAAAPAVGHDSLRELLAEARAAFDSRPAPRRRCGCGGWPASPAPSARSSADAGAGASASAARPAPELSPHAMIVAAASDISHGPGLL